MKRTTRSTTVEGLTVSYRVVVTDCGFRGLLGPRPELDLLGQTANREYYTIRIGSQCPMQALIRAIRLILRLVTTTMHSP